MNDFKVWEPTELEIIGMRINAVYLAAYNAIDTYELTHEDIEKFGDYLSKQDACMAIFNPTFFMQGGDQMLTDARERIDLVEKFFELREKERAHKKKVS